MSLIFNATNHCGRQVLPNAAEFLVGMLVFMNTKICTCFIVLIAAQFTLRAQTVLHLNEDWRLQSACKLQVGGDKISQSSAPEDGWLKTAVPSTVLAAQAAAGVVPDPYYGDNL